MAVLSVKQSWSMSSAGGDAVRRTGARGFTVLLDGADDIDRATLLGQTAPGIPRVGEAHPADGWLRAGRAQVSVRSPILLEVRVDYAVQTGGGADNPLLARPTRRWTWAVSQEEVDRAYDGKPIVNSAGQPFDMLPVAEFVDPVLEIGRNEAADNPALRIKYAAEGGAINSDPFYGAQPGQARMLAIEAEEVQSGNFIYWHKTYRVQFRAGPAGEPDSAKKAWCRRVLDQGTWGARIVQAATAGQSQLVQQIRKFVDERGFPLDRPVLLDGHGALLARGQAPTYLYFERGPRLPFGIFHL